MADRPYNQYGTHLYTEEPWNQRRPGMCPAQKSVCGVLLLGRVGVSQETDDSTGEALRGDTGFASVFGPQNEGHKFTRKCNLTLDTSMAKPTPKPLLRMVERGRILGMPWRKCGAPPFEEAPGLMLRLRFVGFCLVFVFSWKFITPTELKLCKTQTGRRRCAL